MKKRTKIICIVLCVALLVPCLTVFTFAYSDPDTPLYWIDERGYYCDSYASEEWENFIDVDKYRENAGKPGYDQLRLVGISSPHFSSSTIQDGTERVNFYASIDFYFYNPQYFAYLIDEYAGSSLGGVSGTFSIDTQNEFIDKEFVSGMYVFDHPYGYCAASLFSCGTIRVLIATLDSGESLKFDSYIDSFEFYIETVNFYGLDFENESIEYTFDLNKTIKTENIADFIEYSSPYKDLTTLWDMDVENLKKQYPAIEGRYDQSVVFLYENGNNLYLYCYQSSEQIPSQKYDKNTLPGVWISTDDIEYAEYELEWICTEGAISKFRIKDSWKLVDSYKDASTRTYYINSVWFQIVGDANCKFFDIDCTFSSEVTKTDGETRIKTNGNQIYLRDTGYTYYRLNSSVNSEGYYQTLSSFYFSVPETYFELDDDKYYNDRWVERINGKYESAMSKYTVFCSTNEMLDAFRKGIYKNGNFYGWMTGYGRATLPGVANQQFKTGDVGCFKEDNYPIGFLIDEVVSSCSYYNKLVNINEEMAFLFEFSENDVKNLFANGEYEGEISKVEFNFKKGDTTALLSRDSKTLSQLAEDYGIATAYWAKLFGFTDNVTASIRDIPVIYTLYPEDVPGALELSKDEFCSTYLVAPEHYEKVKTDMGIAAAQNEVFVLLRFDVYDYYSDGIYVYTDFLGGLGGLGRQFKDERDEAVACQTKMYKGFEVMELELANSYDSVIYETKMTPISFSGSFTAPDPFDPSEDLPGVGDIVDGLIPDPPSNWWDDLLAKLENGLNTAKTIAVAAGVVMTAVVVLSIVSSIRRKRD